MASATGEHKAQHLKTPCAFVIKPFRSSRLPTSALSNLLLLFEFLLENLMEQMQPLLFAFTGLSCRVLPTVCQDLLDSTSQHL